MLLFFSFAHYFLLILRPYVLIFFLYNDKIYIVKWIIMQ